MTEPSPALTRYDLEAKIVKRCWQDEEFRKEFTADPVATAVKYLEIPAANLPNIVVHEEPAGSWHIVLPAEPVEIPELSEEDLEKVAGGTTPGCISITIFVGSIVVGSGVSASAAITIKEGW
jgi:hypothetical protein